MDDERHGASASAEANDDDLSANLPMAAEPQAGEAALGARIRAVRERRRLSLGKLAEKAQVSKSLVHQIERGAAKPSIDTLRKLASALGVPVFSLFLGDLNSQMVVRANMRRSVTYAGSQVTRAILSPSLNGRMVLLWATFPPGEIPAAESVQHVGEECVVVLKGSLEVMLGQQVTRLEQGDSMTFDPELPHTFRNPNAEPAEAIVAISPPNL